MSTEHYPLKKFRLCAACHGNHFFSFSWSASIQAPFALNLLYCLCFSFSSETAANDQFSIFLFLLHLLWTLKQCPPLCSSSIAFASRWIAPWLFYQFFFVLGLSAAMFLMVSSKLHLQDEERLNPPATCRTVYQAISSKSFFSPSADTRISGSLSGELLTQFNSVTQISNFVLWLTFDSRRKVCTLGVCVSDRVQILGAIFSKKDRCMHLRSHEQSPNKRMSFNFSQFISLGTLQDRSHSPTHIVPGWDTVGSEKLSSLCCFQSNYSGWTLWSPWNRFFLSARSYSIPSWEFRVWSELHPVGTASLLIEF